MPLKEFIQAISKVVIEKLGGRFTGKISFSVNIKDGNICNTDVEIKTKLER